MFRFVRTSLTLTAGLRLRSRHASDRLRHNWRHNTPEDDILDDMSDIESGKTHPIT